MADRDRTDRLTGTTICGNVVSMTNDATAAAEAIARLQRTGKTPSQILTGLGHPNYQDRQARRILRKVTRSRRRMTLNQALYGRREAEERLT